MRIFCRLFGLWSLFFSLSLLAQDQRVIDQAEAALKKGVWLYQKKEYLKAIPHFLESYRLINYPLRLQNIARCYERARKYPQALEYYLLFALHTQDKEKIPAIQKRLLSLIPLYANSQAGIQINRLADLLAALKKTGRAESLPAVHLIAGITYFKIQSYEIARGYLKKGLMAQDLSGNITVYPLIQEMIRQIETQLALLKKPEIPITVQKPIPPETAKDQQKGWSLVSAGIISFLGGVGLFGYYAYLVDDTKSEKDRCASIDCPDYNNFRDKNKEKAVMSLVFGSLLTAGSLAMIPLGIYYLVRAQKQKAKTTSGGKVWISAGRSQGESEGKASHIQLFYQREF